VRGSIKLKIQRESSNFIRRKLNLFNVVNFRRYQFNSDVKVRVN